MGLQWHFISFKFHTSLWISVRLLCDTRSFAAKRTFLRLLASHVAIWLGFLVRCETSESFNSENCFRFQQIVRGPSLSRTLRPATSQYKIYSKGSLSDKLQTNHYDYWRSWNYCIFEYVVDLYVEAKTFPVFCTPCSRWKRSYPELAQPWRAVWNWKSGNKIIVYQLPVKQRTLC